MRRVLSVDQLTFPTTCGALEGKFRTQLAVICALCFKTLTGRAMKLRLWRIALLLVVSSACSDAGPSAPDTASSSNLLGSASGPVFPRFQSGAKPAIRQVSFWAVAGAQRELTINYGNGNDVYLHFVVGPTSLLMRPNGALFLPRDSVLITVTLDNSDLMIAHFEPS